jgi:hypothetical protein
MSVNLLKNFDAAVAAGILARAVLALGSSNQNPESAYLVPNEENIRLSLYEEAARATGASGTMEDPRILDWLEELMDVYSDPVDPSKLYIRLSEEGSLPSDLYEITFSNVFDSRMEALPGDRDLANEVIRHPDMSVDYGINDFPKPSMTAMFGKWVGNPSEKGYCLFIAICQKQEAVLQVYYVWRVFPSCVNLSGAENLVTIYNRFAHKYGFEFIIDTFRGKFLYFLRIPNVRWELVYPRQFFAVDAGKADASFVDVAFASAINMKKYSRDLRRAGLLQAS